MHSRDGKARGKAVKRTQQKYRVTFYYQAAKVVHISAETPEEAHGKALAFAHASICHQCGEELELNDDPIGIEVADEKGVIVLQEGE